MGKIKSKLIRRSSKTFLEKGIEFEGNFEKNKKILGSTMPSKKLRNQMAGCLTREKKQQKKEEKHEGCNNCIEGYIKFPIVQNQKDAKYPYNMVELMQFMMYPFAKIPCQCTRSNKIKDKLLEMQNLFFSDRKIYEFCYISMFVFCNQYLNEKRFPELDQFNLYEIWDVQHEPCHVLKESDLLHFQISCPKISRQSDLKRIPDAEVYNKKLYSEG